MEDLMPTTFPDRLAEPGARMNMSIEGGRHIELTADDAGVVAIASAEQAAVADHFGLATAPTPTRSRKRTQPTTDTEQPGVPAEEA